MDHLFVETKFATEDSGLISGVAWKYGVPDRVGDMIEPGAFKSLQLPLPMLFSHDTSDPVGTWTAADEKDGGLYLKGQMLVADVARAREVLALVKSGAVKGLSIGFITKSATTRPGGGRTIKSAQLLEVSLVVIPMHPGARVTSAKSATAALQLAAALNRAKMALTRS